MKNCAFYDVVRDVRSLFMAEVGPEMHFRSFKPGCYSMEQISFLVSLAMVKLFLRKPFIL